MKLYKMSIVSLKSKPIIVLTTDDSITITKHPEWKQKFKQVEKNTYHIATTIIEDVFNKNSDILGNWHDAKFENDGLDKYYGFTKIKGTDCHCIELSKRFVADWENEYTALFRYTVNRENNGLPPIIKECLYDASVYGNSEVGNVTEEAIKKYILEQFEESKEDV